jgi:hypothetical protein
MAGRAGLVSLTTRTFVIVGNQQATRFVGIIEEQTQQVREMLSIIQEQREYISSLTGLLCDERLSSDEPAGNC